MCHTIFNCNHLFSSSFSAPFTLHKQLSLSSRQHQTLTSHQLESLFPLDRQNSDIHFHCMLCSESKDTSSKMSLFRWWTKKKMYVKLAQHGISLFLPAKKKRERRQREGLTEMGWGQRDVLRFLHPVSSCNDLCSELPQPDDTKHSHLLYKAVSSTNNSFIHRQIWLPFEMVPAEAMIPCITVTPRLLAFIPPHFVLQPCSSHTPSHKHQQLHDGTMDHQHQHDGTDGQTLSLSLSLSHTHTHTHTYTHTHTHTHTHTRSLLHEHAHPHTHIRTHTHTQMHIVYGCMLRYIAVKTQFT